MNKLIHSFYGLLLFASILASGTTVLHLCARILKLDDNDLRIFGIPAGLLVCLGASLVARQGMAGQFFQDRRQYRLCNSKFRLLSTMNKEKPLRF